MDNKRLSFLLQKRQQGLISHEENEELLNWYNSLEYPVDSSSDDENIGREMLSEFRRGLREDDPRVVPVRRWSSSRFNYLYRVAAAVLLICGLSFLLYYNNSGKVVTGQYTSIQKPSNKFITLPDGSVVILKHNSKLTYLNSFRGKSREVALVGEAYFDVKKDPARPFIIRTGKISTRVLGTAFNIDAGPGKKSIVVTVTRGKVQVENHAKVLAVLLPGKQATYNKSTKSVSKQNVNAEIKTEWAKHDLQFEEVRFGEIAGYLSDTYGKKIEFAEATLANCLITASFTGEESLREVLDIVCLTRGAVYNERDGRILISGEGCGNSQSLY